MYISFLKYQKPFQNYTIKCKSAKYFIFIEIQFRWLIAIFKTLFWTIRHSSSKDICYTTHDAVSSRVRRPPHFGIWSSMLRHDFQGAVTQPGSGIRWLVIYTSMSGLGWWGLCNRPLDMVVLRARPSPPRSTIHVPRGTGLPARQNTYTPTPMNRCLPNCAPGDHNKLTKKENEIRPMCLKVSRSKRPPDWKPHTSLKSELVDLVAKRVKWARAQFQAGKCS